MGVQIPLSVFFRYTITPVLPRKSKKEVLPPKTSDGGSPTNALLGKLVLTPHQALGVKVVSAVLIGLLVVFRVV